MEKLPFRPGPFDSPDQLLKALRETIKLLHMHDDQSVAIAMANQIVTAGHDKWWSDDQTDPVITQLANLLLHLELPSKNTEQRQRDWATVEHLLSQ